jgi:hypothetical protein
MCDALASVSYPTPAMTTTPVFVAVLGWLSVPLLLVWILRHFQEPRLQTTGWLLAFAYRELSTLYDWPDPNTTAFTIGLLLVLLSSFKQYVVLQGWASYTNATNVQWGLWVLANAVQISVWRLQWWNVWMGHANRNWDGRYTLIVD